MRHPLPTLLLSALIVLAAVVPSPAAAQAPHPFQLVMIDDATEVQYGRFPLSRDLTARAVLRLTQAGARAVVLKFFYDEPRDNAVDSALASAISQGTVLLQARIDDSAERANTLSPRFGLSVPPGPTPIIGQSGWIPIPLFANRAAAVGLVDVTRSDRIPAFGRYKDMALPSLTVAAIAMAVDGGKPVIEPGKQIRFGNRTLPLDAESQITLSPTAFDNADGISYLSFGDIIGNKAVPSTVRGKVVVIGYHGSQMHRLSTSAGSLKAHQVFWLGLLDAWAQLK